MTDYLTVNVRKASATGNSQVDSVAIQVGPDTADADGFDPWADAQNVAKWLRASLPQATLDQLTAQLLLLTASGRLDTGPRR